MSTRVDEKVEMSIYERVETVSGMSTEVDCKMRY